ncbi:MAG: hypothetical protein NC483_06920 [Ruminococcus sp.]|nr:hypothetical protein [Ruminococcus sp.]
MLIAHRGLVKDDIKENSLEAFKAAINSSKYAGFELDIYTSKDKEFVVNHDPLVEGKFIWNMTYKELKKKGIIKLESVLKLNTSKIILIEIKDINIDIIKLTKLLDKYSNKKIYVMSFFNSVIRKFKERTFKIGILNYVLNSTSIYPYDFMGILYDVANYHMINSLQKLNIEVFLYALNKHDKYLYNNVYYIVDDW